MISTEHQRILRSHCRKLTKLCFILSVSHSLPAPSLETFCLSSLLFGFRAPCARVVVAHKKGNICGNHLVICLSFRHSAARGNGRQLFLRSNRSEKLLCHFGPFYTYLVCCALHARIKKQFRADRVLPWRVYGECKFQSYLRAIQIHYSSRLYYLTVSLSRMVDAG